MPKQFRDENTNEDGEKPFKKARYVWEVKGKHHLKNNNNNEQEVLNKKIIPNKCCNSCCIQKLLEETDDDDYEIPLTLVTPNPKNEEYYLHKWQSRQMARGFVDNTINNVLESWSNRPLDVADLVDNYDNGGKVEDDAILMAIQSHGLQLEKNVEIEEFRNDNLENVEKERDGGICSTTDGADDLIIEDNMDFLSAAVSVAIQKKGLNMY